MTFLATEAADPALTSIGTPTLWTVTILGVIALFVFDFIITRKPHEVAMREAIGWTCFYIALPITFGVWVWNTYGSDTGIKYYTGYLVEKCLSVDNLFVFMVIIASFAVPRALQQRVLLVGVAGALVLRAIFIAVGAQLIANFAATFLVFGAILLFIPPMIMMLIAFIEFIIYLVKSDQQFHQDYVVGNKSWF